MTYIREDMPSDKYRAVTQVWQLAGDDAQNTRWKRRRSRRQNKPIQVGSESAMSEWVLEVSEVNEYVRQLLQNEPALRKVRLRGEISNFKRHSSGHWYFTLTFSRMAFKSVS